MQFFRNAVLSAPTSFLALASLRHAVRLACFAAASLEGAAADGAGDPAGGGAAAAAGAVAGAAAAGCAGAAANTPLMGKRQRHAAVATVEKRMLISLESLEPLTGAQGLRIALRSPEADDALMKLA
jgi:hypothetical protein